VSELAFPAASYFIASSRLRPGLDGGYTVATMRRALQFAEVGDVQPVLLAFDFSPDYERYTREFVELGLATEATVIRSLYQDLRDDPSIVRAAARPVIEARKISPGSITETTDVDADGRPWRTVATGADGVITHTDFLDGTGAPLFRLPYISGRPDWWRSEIVIDVFEGGAMIGQLHGFADLYQAWVNHLVARVDGPSVVVVEARQVGEMLVGPRGYKLVHTVHNAHTAAPHRWDSPMDDTWTGWFETVDGYDAIIWLTEQQREDAERRFGAHRRSVVIPHPAEPLESFPPTADRDPDLAVMVARLADQKRIAHAIRAWPTVLAARPSARLEVYGDGVQRAALESLVAELGLENSVAFMGYRANASEVMRTAGLLVVSSNFEGHSLVVLEAFSRGCPIVSYDISYGPAETIVDGVNGLLVPAGDIEALGTAIGSVIGDAPRLAQLSRGAYDWAVSHGVERSMALTRDLMREVLDD
jgi:poly(glycerol-phosphate) alpha-glucosyltransferase